MNSAGKNAVMVLLAISLAGCTEKKPTTPPPAQAQAPSIDAGKAGAMYPPPLTPAQPQPEEPTPAPPPVVAKTEPEPEPQAQPEKTKKPATNTRKPKQTPAQSPAKPATTPAPSSDTPDTSTPATSATQATPPVVAPETPATTDVATAGEPLAATPIGQLSTGDLAGQAQTRKETVDLITNTESGLNGIKRPLNAQEQETANQIKNFLTKARAALKNDDLDGALTLATKAKVLLDELNKT